MSLRLRLSLSLAALLVVGLAAFGAATYSFYAPSQLSQLDAQLRSSVEPIADRLEQQAKLEPAPSGPLPPPSVVLAPGSYAALVSPSGAVMRSDEIVFEAGGPSLSAAQLRPPAGKAERFFSTASVKAGGPTWRVLVTAASGVPGYVVVVAEPMTGLDTALHRLVLVETVAAVILLALLLAAAWLILRRGLRPLERIAHDSQAIAAGDLSHRVEADRGPTEVIELGVALNTMLAEIERSFAERVEAEAGLRRFLADVSHELRTPLTSIQGFAELLRLGPGGGAATEPALAARRIEAEAGRMKRLVDDLLLLARLDQQPQAVREEVELTVVAADACTAAAAVAPDRRISLEAPEPVVVLGDAGHLGRAVANLLTNALRHTPPRSPIEVSVTRHGGDEAMVSIRDHGGGLDPDALAHAFERFWTADRSRAGESSGLGRSIVAAIVAEHGGTVEADNAEGGGARFSIRLPLAGDQQSTAASRQTG